MAGLSFSQPILVACSGCALAGVCVLIAGLALRRRGYGGRPLTPRGIASVTIPAVGLMLAAAWWFGLHEPFRDPPILPPTGSLAIALGDEFPSMVTGGWLNGTAPTMGDLLGKVIVVDIWNEL
ncbi:MAG TPA: hypothetical protein VHC22_31230 [Pirellulales bacterium]|nr:hypothetical protein [Pirellulales bacterium]